MTRRHNRGPSPGWREFLKRHESNIWACVFFCVRTIWFQTLYVFLWSGTSIEKFLHVTVTPCPTAEWTARQIVECCPWDRWPPRFLIHDRDSRYGATFERRVRHLGIEQVRTPFRAPRPLIYLQRSWSAWSNGVVSQLLQSLASASIASPTRRAIRHCSGLEPPAARSSRRTSSGGLHHVYWRAA
jgi:hypothetical protein